VKAGGVLAGMALAGHQTPEMVQRIYTHLHAEPMRPMPIK